MSRAKEQGVALIVALVLLVIVTLLGVGAMNTVLLEEKMSGNLSDRATAFQIAEAQLRQAEMLALRLTIDQDVPPSGCRDSVCAEPDPTINPPRYRNLNAQGWSNWVDTQINPTYQTRYLIEYLGRSSGSHILRVNAAAQRKDGVGSLVILQSVIRRP
ncbi:MAG TPA: PilX N-terminal domain-containing pilus assembly protein [Hydrogenophilus thermoluteolus]|nr:PilX N-terminal domain-containing pilus assembly protein [Hydrogenophilus thermoluteolus]